MPSLFNITACSLAALLSIGSVSPSLGQDNTDGSTPTPPVWPLTCTSPNAATGALNCQIEQRFFRQQTRELVMVLTIAKTSVNESVAMNLILPHGLRLPSGVSYQVDTGAVATAAIVSSGQNGAVTSIPIPPEFLTVLKAGTTLTLKVQTAAGAELSIPVSLAGFTAAIDRMSAIK